MADFDTIQTAFTIMNCQYVSIPHAQRCKSLGLMRSFYTYVRRFRLIYCCGGRRFRQSWSLESRFPGCTGTRSTVHVSTIPNDSLTEQVYVDVLQDPEMWNIPHAFNK